MIWHSIPKGIKIKVLVCNLFVQYGDKEESQSASMACWRTQPILNPHLTSHNKQQALQHAERFHLSRFFWPNWRHQSGTFSKFLTERCNSVSNSRKQEWELLPLWSSSSLFFIVTCCWDLHFYLGRKGHTSYDWRLIYLIYIWDWCGIQQNGKCLSRPIQLKRKGKVAAFSRRWKGTVDKSAIAEMEMVWDSTRKPIFRDYSKYEAEFLQ